MASRARRMKSQVGETAAVRPSGGQVRLPTYVLILGCAEAAFMLILALLASLLGGKLLPALALAAMALLGAALVVAWFHCRIDYGADGFTHRNFWGRRRSYTYDQLESYTGDRNITDICLYAGDRRIRVDKIATNGAEFVKFALQRYKEIHYRQLPWRSVKRFDIFNGNVRGAGEFLFVYLLLFAYLIGMLAWIVTSEIKPVTADDAVHSRVAFASCDIDGEELHLYAPGTPEPYIIFARGSDLEGMDRIAALCGADLEFDVWTQYVEPKGEGAYHRICALQQGDAVLYSFADATAYKRRDVGSIAAIFGGLLAIWSLYVAASVHVGRHPNKFNRRVVRLFFKDGTLRKY